MATGIRKSKSKDQVTRRAAAAFGAAVVRHLKDEKRLNFVLTYKHTLITCEQWHRDKKVAVRRVQKSLRTRRETYNFLLDLLNVGTRPAAEYNVEPESSRLAVRPT